MKDLIGKKIQRIFVSSDQGSIQFVSNPDILTYFVDGDCCSESWFADILGTSALLGGIVNAVNEISMNGYNVNDGRGRQEVDKVYGYKIFTDRGQADIIFRNSSNGYYGGWLREVEYDVNVSVDAEEILADWSA